MRLAERLGKRRASSRGFHTAVVTTFAVDFCGFEEIILPQLATAGATNILLICDERMSALALNDGSILPRKLGRNYALFCPDQAAGVFPSQDCRSAWAATVEGLSSAPRMPRGGGLRKSGNRDGGVLHG